MGEEFLHKMAKMLVAAGDASGRDGGTSPSSPAADRPSARSAKTHRLRETSFYFWRTEIAKRDREAAFQSAPSFVPKSLHPSFF
jgi:hypothetical protein